MTTARSRSASCVLALLLGQAACTGQSGSEAVPSGQGGMGAGVGTGGQVGSGEDHVADDALCPCERLAGKAPFAASVVSWESTLLTLDVDEVLIDDPPEGTPQPGERVIGMFLGDLPCYRGTFTPQPGERVVAYLFPDEPIPSLCCDVAACEEPCADEPSVDECLVACQVPAREACEAERAQLPIAGQLVVAPLGDTAIELARVEDVSFTAARDELGAIFEGGSACEAAVGEVREALSGLFDPGSAGGAWKSSCADQDAGQ